MAIEVFAFFVAVTSDFFAGLSGRKLPLMNVLDIVKPRLLSCEWVSNEADAAVI
jgi:hypothetical protein